MLMRLWVTIPLFFATACVNATPTSLDAVCSGTRAARASHAEALAETQDERVLMTGARLIALVDAGCGK